MLAYLLTDNQRHSILLKLKGVSWWTSPAAARRADEVITVLKNLPKAAPSTSQWQSIETAPKNGTEILLCSAKNRIANGMWRFVNADKGYWAWPYVNVEPAHWMPLPTPALKGGA